MNSFQAVKIWWRLATRKAFQFLRGGVFFVWRLWVGRVEGMENLPLNSSAIIVANHLSYFDFFIMASILRVYAVFVAVKNLNQRAFVGWFMQFDHIIYIDREKPGYKFFKDLLWHIKQQRRLVVIYPEGTRSRSGSMMMPKPGFVKLAIKAGVPIVPVSLRGTYEILPPHKHFPRLRKCHITVHKKIYISPATPEFHDVFFKRQGQDRKYGDLDDSEQLEIAFRIMDKIRIAAGQSWDESVVRPKFDVPPDVARELNEKMLQP